MIWNSVTTMTVIDLFIVAGLCVCLHVYFRFSRRLYGHRNRLGPLLILFGVGLISLVHVADLAIMHGLPTVMPGADQVAVMEGLHLDWSWISTVLGTGFIFIGFILINRNTLAAMGRLENLEKSLAAELSSRVGEREALRRSEANLVNAQRIARIGSCERNLADGTGWWSDEAYRLLGYEPRSVPPTIDKYLSQVHPHDRERVWAASGAGKSGAAPYSYDYKIVLPDGSLRYLRAWGETETGADGRAILSRGTVQDITEQNRPRRRCAPANKGIAT